MVGLDELRTDVGDCNNENKCDFDKDLCGYKDGGLSGDWKLISVQDNVTYGPNTDHSTNSQQGEFLPKILERIKRKVMIVIPKIHLSIIIINSQKYVTNLT